MKDDMRGFQAVYRVNRKISGGARPLEGMNIRSRYKFGMGDKSVCLGRLEL
jgi:hypothetical protein